MIFTLTRHIFAMEKENVLLDEVVFSINLYILTISEKEVSRKVVTYDTQSNQEYVAIYNKETSTLLDENGDGIGHGHEVAP